jgi:hypothetical protein
MPRRMTGDVWADIAYRSIKNEHLLYSRRSGCAYADT